MAGCAQQVICLGPALLPGQAGSLPSLEAGTFTAVCVPGADTAWLQPCPVMLWEGSWGLGLPQPRRSWQSRGAVKVQVAVACRACPPRLLLPLGKPVGSGSRAAVDWGAGPVHMSLPPRPPLNQAPSCRAGSSMWYPGWLRFPPVYSAGSFLTILSVGVSVGELCPPRGHAGQRGPEPWSQLRE